MIRKLIRKLLGRAPDDSDDAAESDTGVLADGKRNNPAAARYPDTPVIIAAEVHGIDPALISSSALRVTQTLQQAGHHAFIVGGAVRDLLLGVAPKDFDVATDAAPEEVQRLFRRARLIGRRFQIVHVQFGQELVEVSTFRALADPDLAAPAPAPAPAAILPDAPAQAIPVLSNHGRRRRTTPERRAHTVDASGRVLRDNVWGEQHEDATRRDFTINAMYYDPATQTVLDYHDGMADIRAGRLRIIGDPVKRYREDPVRMLRVVRFAAKLGFEIEPGTRAPLGELANLLDNVPTARLFDELLKLLLSGQALACLRRLRTEGLHHALLPSLDAALADPQGEKFITLALGNTDQRVRAGKPVSPGFLFAALFWRQVDESWQRRLRADDHPIPALHEAIDEVLDAQTRKLAVQRRFVADMKEIWGLQPRLEKRSGRSALKLIEHQRFRAGYDFLLLRCESGELEAALGQWWTEFIQGDAAVRETLLGALGKDHTPRKRRRRGGAHAGQRRGAGLEQDGTTRAIDQPFGDPPD